MSLLDHELALRLEKNERLRDIIRRLAREEARRLIREDTLIRAEFIALIREEIEQERVAAYVRDASKLLFRDERKGLES